LRISKEKIEGLWTGYQSLGMHRKQNFKLVLGFKNDTVVLTFLLPSSFTFRASLFFFCCASGFILVGKDIKERFYDLVITLYTVDERKGRWIVEQDFHGNFQVNITWLFPFSLASLTESYSFWYGLKDLCNLHELADKMSLTTKTDDITRSRRELDQHEEEGGGGGTGGLGGNVETPFEPYLLPPIFSTLFIKMYWRTLKRNSLQSYFLHLQHQTLAPSFAIVQTGSGLGQKILDIFVLETARVNGTDISESLRPTVTKKNILLVKVEFLRFLTCIELPGINQKGKVN